MPKLYTSKCPTTFAKVHLLVSDLHAESAAMLSALYSRSPMSVAERLRPAPANGDDAFEVNPAMALNSTEFMDKFYVGYGHDSIGDCAEIRLYIEDISQDVAVAITHSPLFNGQECSTRYLDFSKQGLANQIFSIDSAKEDFLTVTEKADAMSQEWLNLYEQAFSFWFNHYGTELGDRYGGQEDMESKVRAQARTMAFDKARGFLPIAVKTNVAWNSSLRAVREHLQEMAASSASAVRNIAFTAAKLLHEHYPGSGFEAIYKTKRKSDTYWYSDAFPASLPLMDNARTFHQNRDLLSLNPAWAEEVSERKRGDKMPRFFETIADLSFSVDIDYAAYRDLHRHRRQYIDYYHPSYRAFIGEQLTLHPFYLEGLPDDLTQKALSLCEDFSALIDYFDDTLNYDESVVFTPMGHIISVDVKLDLAQYYYLMETRSAPTVHITLRAAMEEVHNQYLEDHRFQKIMDQFPLHADFQREDVHMKRGQQDIVEKG